MDLPTTMEGRPKYLDWLQQEEIPIRANISSLASLLVLKLKNMDVLCLFKNWPDALS